MMRQLGCWFCWLLILGAGLANDARATAHHSQAQTTSTEAARQPSAQRRLLASSCPAGRTPSPRGQCRPCPPGWFCPAGKPPTRCSNKLTSVQGARSASNCVNAAGYYYVASTGQRASAVQAAAAGSVGAEPCPPDTYSPGFDYAPACTPCPAGFKTDPNLPAGNQTSAAVCLAPPGYTISDGAVVPCEKGSYSDTYSNDTCISCITEVGIGVTTAGPGASSSAECRYLEPGFAVADAKGDTVLGPLSASQVFAKAVPCPQGYYCPGGDPVAEGAPQACPRAMWTQVQEYAHGADEDLDAGASSADQCLAPPGHYLPDDGSDMQECPSGTYKEGWDRASSCTPCGQGLFLSDPLTILIKLDPKTQSPSEVTVRGSSETCYIQQGMGVTVGSNGAALRAVICPIGFYGNDAEKRYGVQLTPCRACPSGLVTMGGGYRAQTYTDSQGTGVGIAESEGGYYNVKACGTRPGWGYYGGENGAVAAAAAARECQAGEWNEGGNLDKCKECRPGTTTTGPGATSSANCTLYAAGYGLGPDGTTQPCPIGTYSDGTGLAGTSSCKACPAGTTTKEAGTSSAQGCNLCAQGFGGKDAGSCKPCQDGYYGPEPARRSYSTECKLCPTGRTYTYDWNSGPDTYAPRATSPVQAGSASECLAEMFQILDGSFYLDLKISMDYIVAPEYETLRSCMDYCGREDGCAVATYDYYEGDCKVWKPRGAISSSFSTHGGLAFKTVESAYIVDALSTDPNTNKTSRSSNTATVSSQTGKGNDSGGRNWLQGAPLKRILLADVQAQSFGSGMYSYWPDASTAAATIAASSLLSEQSVSKLDDCLWKCTMDRMCAGVAFGAYDVSTGKMTSVIPGSNTKCQRIMGYTKPGDSRRSMIKARYTALDPK